MNGVITGDHLVERMAHPWRVKQPAVCRREVAYGNAVERDGNAEGHVGFAGAIDIRREHIDLVSSGGERPAEPVDGIDRSAVSGGGKVGRDDVKQAHARYG